MAWFSQNKVLTEFISQFSNFLHCTFCLQHVFAVLISSDFARNSNLNFSSDTIDNGANRLSVPFFMFEKFGFKQWVFYEKISNFKWRRCKYAITWSGCGGGHARSEQSFLFHLYCIVFVIIKSCFHSAFSFMHFQSCNWTEKSHCNCFSDHNIFR